MSATNSPTPSSTAVQTWASGRVLSAEQRRRKRAVNRETARRSKETQRSQLEELSKRVQELEAWRAKYETHNPGLAGTSEATVAEERDPGNTYYGAATTIDTQPDVIYGHIRSDSSFALASGGLDFPDDAVSSMAQGLTWSDNDPNLKSKLDQDSTTPGLNLMEDDLLMTGYDSTDLSNAFAMPETAALVKPTYARENDLAIGMQRLDPRGREITRACNAAVAEVRSLAPQDVCTNDFCNQDILVRAVLLQGWDEGLARYTHPCPLWRILRNVDVLLFERCDLKDRICALRIIHLMYLYEVCAGGHPGDNDLPWWYRPRPSQQYFPHEPVIDHLAWPGLRERLTLSENNSLTNQFWKLFAENFRFITTKAPHDMVQERALTPYYQLSPELESSILNIDQYRMAPGFFAAFPHFRDDIGTAESSPLSIISLPLPSSGDQDVYLREALSKVREGSKREISRVRRFRAEG